MGENFTTPITSKQTPKKPTQIRVKKNDWRRGVVFITIAQLHLTKIDISFGAGSNPAHGVLEIPDGEDLWQPLTGNQAKCLSLVNYTIKAIHHHNRFHHQESQIFKSFKPFSPVCFLLLQLAQTIVFLSDGITEDILSYKNLSLSWALF